MRSPIVTPQRRGRERTRKEKGSRGFSMLWLHLPFISLQKGQVFPYGNVISYDDNRFTCVLRLWRLFWPARARWMGSHDAFRIWIWRDVHVDNIPDRHWWNGIATSETDEVYRTQLVEKPARRHSSCVKKSHSLPSTILRCENKPHLGRSDAVDKKSACLFYR